MYAASLGWRRLAPRTTVSGNWGSTGSAACGSLAASLYAQPSLIQVPSTGPSGRQWMAPFIGSVRCRVDGSAASSSRSSSLHASDCPIEIDAERQVARHGAQHVGEGDL